MHHKRILSIFTFIFLIIIVPTSPAPGGKLLVISFGGFIDGKGYRDLMPRLRTLKRCGRRYDNVAVDFPSTKLPYHMTIATGSNVQEHSMYNDYQFDSNNKCVDLIKAIEDNTADPIWNTLRPIWWINDNTGWDGYHSGLMMWPGGSKDYFTGRSPTYYHPKENKYPMEYYMNMVISWFLNDEQPANLVMFHIDGPSKVSEMYGPESLETMNEIQKVDNLIHYMMHKIYTGGRNAIIPDLNIVFITDHSTQTVSSNANITINATQMCGKSPLKHIKADVTFDGKYIDEITKPRLQANVYNDNHNKCRNFSEIFGNQAGLEKTFGDNDYLFIAQPRLVFGDDVAKIVTSIYNEKALLYKTDTKSGIKLGVSGYNVSQAELSKGSFSSIRHVNNHPTFYGSKIIAIGPKIKKEDKLKKLPFMKKGLPPSCIQDLFHLFIKILELPNQNSEKNGSAWLEGIIQTPGLENMNWYTSYFKAGNNENESISSKSLPWGTSITTIGTKIPDYPKDTTNK